MRVDTLDRCLCTFQKGRRLVRICHWYKNKLQIQSKLKIEICSTRQPQLKIESAMSIPSHVLNRNCFSTSTYNLQVIAQKHSIPTTTGPHHQLQRLSPLPAHLRGQDLCLGFQPSARLQDLFAEMAGVFFSIVSSGFFLGGSPRLGDFFGGKK